MLKIMETYKIILLGTCGNTTKLLQKFCSEIEFNPDIDNNCDKKIIVENKPCILKLFDINRIAGGTNEEHQDYRDNWLNKADGFLVIYSITSRASFEDIRYYNEIINLRKEYEEIENIPLIIVGNNCSEIIDREVSYEEGYLLAKEMKCKFIEVDTKTNKNIELPFQDIVKIKRNKIMKINQTKPNEKTYKNFIKFVKCVFCN